MPRNREPFNTLQHLFGDVAGNLAKLSGLTTYCSCLAREIMGNRSTEHFEFDNTHFVADGVVVHYRCNLDNRMYTVKVTADPH